MFDKSLAGQIDPTIVAGRDVKEITGGEIDTHVLNMVLKIGVGCGWLPQPVPDRTISHIISGLYGLALYVHCAEDPGTRALAPVLDKVLQGFSIRAMRVSDTEAEQSQEPHAQVINVPPFEIGEPGEHDAAELYRYFHTSCVDIPLRMQMTPQVILNQLTQMLYHIATEHLSADVSAEQFDLMATTYAGYANALRQLGDAAGTRQ